MKRGVSPMKRLAIVLTTVLFALTSAHAADVLIKGRIVLEEEAGALLARDDLGTLYFDLAETG